MDDNDSMLKPVMKSIKVVDNIATGLKAWKERRGFTYRAIAEEMECSIMFYYNLEKGRRKWTDKWVNRFNNAIQKLEEENGKERG